MKLNLTIFDYRKETDTQNWLASIAEDSGLAGMRKTLAAIHEARANQLEREIADLRKTNFKTKKTSVKS